MEKNSSIKNLEQDNFKQDNEFGDHDNVDMKKAYRQIGNYFVRAYDNETSRAFRIWRKNIRENRFKQRILKNTVS